MIFDKPMIKPHNIPFDLGPHGNDARYLRIHFYYVEGYCIPHEDFIKELLTTFVPGGKLMVEIVKSYDIQ